MKSRQNGEVVVVLQSMTCIVFGNHHLVQLFAWANTYDLDFTFRSYRSGQIRHTHAWNFGNKNFATKHTLETGQQKIDALLQSYPETCHSRIRKRQDTALLELKEKWNHTATASDYISITHYAEAGLVTA